MFDERRNDRHYNGITGDSEEVEHRMNMANELAAASTEEAEEEITEIIEDVTSKWKNGEFSNEDLDILLKKIKDIRETQS